MTDENARENEAPSGGESSTDAPLSDLAERVAQRREEAGVDRSDERFERFAEQSFEAVEPGALWDAGDESEFGAVGEVVEEGEETYVVDKGNFCERCRYFSAPPDVRCTHPGTAIREFVDKEHVRLSSCPIVEERGLVNDDPVG